MNALLIHRDEHLRAILETSLAGRGLCFFEATESRRAVQKLCHQHFQAIILDETLPETEGTTFLARLADDFPEIPIIFLVENPKSRVAEFAPGAGAFAILGKPVHPFQISKVLEAAKKRFEMCRCSHVSDDCGEPMPSKTESPKRKRLSEKSQSRSGFADKSAAP